MFKKSPAELKTSSALRNSDRRKLAAEVSSTFKLTAEECDLLVPDGLQARKFKSSGGEPGTIYQSPDGEPLWFVAGKQSSTLVPTVYTLWRRPGMVPMLHTPAFVIEKLSEGADLMIPGVLETQEDLQGVSKGDLAAIAAIGSDVPVAIGTMAVSPSSLGNGMKGKAALILHVYQDHLWEMGSKSDPPASLPQASANPDEMASQLASTSIGNVQASDGADTPTQPPAKGDDDDVPAGESEDKTRPADVDVILRTALVHAIATKLSKLPSSSFPILGTNLYAVHILPARPFNAPPDADIKHSSYKKLARFLKAAEKDGLIKTKDVKGETWLTSVNATHLDVAEHKGYKSIADADKKDASRKEQEKKQADKTKKDGIAIMELYKPHGVSTALFDAVKQNTDELYTGVEVRTLLLDYVKEHSLVHPREQGFIILDELLQDVLLKKGEDIEFMRRDDALDRLKSKMQPWYSIPLKEGEPPVVKKGQLAPISAVAKTRQGRRVITLVTHFEPYGIEADDLAESLRKACASATSVTPLPGKTAGSEVLVQGNQLKIVGDLLMERGIPKKWIQVEDTTGKK
ncbi:eukaryotic translation initiation factor SUI1 family protein [Calocera viscosa TUFC12733]|uniref:Eukaryotic translation initiation factor SUI1 family protein n=1 Tax=Calocera viscosa (strain TUFC12733) TaxID=1330018 RepID=A0A167NET9_CALVF|nr:eukaryotic translation initiation factor SUI1 family protein [Calocera viscosa TUFC12733]